MAGREIKDGDELRDSLETYFEYSAEQNLAETKSWLDDLNFQFPL